MIKHPLPGSFFNGDQFLMLHRHHNPCPTAGFERDVRIIRFFFFFGRNWQEIATSGNRPAMVRLTYTRVVQKVRGQLRFYHFNWVNIIHPVYQNVCCEIPIQTKVDFDNFSIFELTNRRCARARVKMLHSLWRSVLIQMVKCRKV
jgi:hypothetical protein